MKKIFKYILTCIIAFMMFVSGINRIDALGSADGPATVTQGQEFSVTVYVNASGVKSGSISVRTDSNLSIVKGTWKPAGASLPNFDGSDGSFAFTEERTLSGAYFTVTLKASGSYVGNATVNFSGQLKDTSGSQIGSVSASKTVKIICSSHSYPQWSVQDATCTNSGLKTRTCSVCGTTETQGIPAKGHSVAQFTTDVEATCTENGSAYGICSVCNQKVSKALPAKGHFFGEWTPIEEASCTEHGKENRTCKDCGHIEERETELATHTMSDEYTVIYEASISQYGLLEGKCSVCGTVFQQQQKCTYAVEEKNMLFECEEGCFAFETVITVDEVDTQQNEQFSSIADISSIFKVFNIQAILNERSMKPNSAVSATLPLPEGFSNNTAVILVKEDGSTKIISSYTDEKNMIHTSLNELGTYALVDLQAYSQQAENKLAEYEKQAQKDKTIEIALAAGCAALSSALAVSLIKKKKKAV